MRNVPTFNNFGRVELVGKTVAIEAFELVIAELKTCLLQEQLEEMLFVDLVAAKTELVA